MIYNTSGREFYYYGSDKSCERKYKKPLTSCTNKEIYICLLEQVKKLAKEKEAASEKTAATTGRRKLYYISAEFLIGKLLSNNLINLGLYDEVKTELAAAGKSLAEIEELEPEPSLGNGGLGRLLPALWIPLLLLD